METSKRAPNGQNQSKVPWLGDRGQCKQWVDFHILWLGGQLTYGHSSLGVLEPESRTEVPSGGGLSLWLADSCLVAEPTISALPVQLERKQTLVSLLLLPRAQIYGSHWIRVPPL